MQLSASWFSSCAAACFEKKSKQRRASQEKDDKEDFELPNGVSLYHLKHVLLPKVEHKFNKSDVSIYDLNEPIIKNEGREKICPRDGKQGAAYVDCLQGEDNVGPATHMISYCWGYTLSDIVNTLCDREPNVRT